MERQARLYTLNYDEGKTYLWTALFIGCNLLLPHAFHLIPQGGIIFAPLSLVILAGAYKLGWKVGLLTAILAGTPVGSTIVAVDIAAFFIFACIGKIGGNA